MNPRLLKKGEVIPVCPKAKSKSYDCKNHPVVSVLVSMDTTIANAANAHRKENKIENKYLKILFAKNSITNKKLEVIPTNKAVAT